MTKREVVLTGAAALLAASFIFPPWNKSWSLTANGTHVERAEPVGYAFIFDPPAVAKDWRVDLAYGRLFVQALAITFGAFVVHSIVRDHERKNG